MLKNNVGANAEEAANIIKETLNSVPRGFDGRAVLLFSGGRDSSAVAAAYCKAFPKSQLHLLFVDNGLLSRIESTGRQARLLTDLFPETDIQFHAKRVSQMMRIAGMQQVEKDFKENGFSTLLICVACKLIMNFSAIRFSKDAGVDIVLDGYADRQNGYPEQTETFMVFAKRMFSQNGILYFSPLYQFLNSREKVDSALEELGVYIYKQEPLCMWSHSFSKANELETSKYLEKTMKIIRENDPILRPGL